MKALRSSILVVLESAYFSGLFTVLLGKMRYLLVIPMLFPIVVVGYRFFSELPALVALGRSYELGRGVAR
jgi:hypothetical protein